MKQFISYIFIIFSVCFKLYAQEFDSTQKEFTVELRVIDKKTNRIIRDANVEVDARSFSFNNIKEYYLVRAKSGSQLIVSHSGFETVFYTIKDDEEIKIEVEDFEPKVRKKSKYAFSKRKKTNLHKQFLDSVQFYQPKSIDKSLTYAEKLLVNSNSKRERSSAYIALGNVYLYWKQYDLAEENYTMALKEQSSVNANLLLAKTQFLGGKHQQSIQQYLKVLNEKLTSSQKLEALEGLGNAYLTTKNYTLAKFNFDKALTIAKQAKKQSKITDLNTKLAEVYAAQGQKIQANNYFANSLELAEDETPTRNLQQQEKVAGYYNREQRYDDEIKLLKKSLKTIAKDSIEHKENDIKSSETLVDSITSQKINYRLGNAYVLKEDYKTAIPYLKKSITEADKSDDLIVQKDATRKLSELYATVGDYTLALKNYEDYVKLVDTLYARKEQEIQQNKRLTKRIADNRSRISSLEKDKELVSSKIDLAYKDQQLAQQENKRQLYIIYSLGAGVFLLSLLAYFMFKNNKQQRLNNNILALKSMRSQMNPHFIFNALNSVNSFIAVNDERSANRYLSEFSTLMRAVLENSDEDFIPLQKEIELLSLYVKLEYNRFQDKFDYTLEVSEAISLEKYTIPPMLLQPYIENAIWHGLRYKKEKGHLSISFKKHNNESVLITIEDNGVGRKQSMAMKTDNQRKQKSKGMSTIANRIAILNTMYPDKIKVALSSLNADETGTRVQLILKQL